MKRSKPLILTWELMESNSWHKMWELKESALGAIARVYSYSKKYCERNKHQYPCIIFTNSIKARDLLPWKKLAHHVNQDVLITECTEGKVLGFCSTFVSNDEIEIKKTDGSIIFEWGIQGE